MMRLVLFHPMDPRGRKLGGIETHVRLVLARHPSATALLLVGIDEIGDRDLGAVEALEYEGRRIDFLPVARVDAGAINRAATTIFQSTTLRFALGALSHLGKVRVMIRGASVSCEVERFEFALFAKLLRAPLVLIVHNEGSKGDKMDSLLKRYWFLHRFNERVALALADRIFAVNASIARRIATLSAPLSSKTEVMSVSVDTTVFSPTPFPREDDCFHICFAGRLDDFKDPPLMVATLAASAKKLARGTGRGFRRVVFDYVGASDPTLVPGFEAIAPFVVRHGIRTAAEVASIMRSAHAGIITSFFEGMPCYLLEMLASGRPVCAISLPQFAALIVEGVSGTLVDRRATPEDSAEALSDAVVALAAAIAVDRLEPKTIGALARPYSAETQMSRLFAWHRRLATGDIAQASASATAA